MAKKKNVLAKCPHCGLDNRTHFYNTCPACGKRLKKNNSHGPKKEKMRRERM